MRLDRQHTRAAQSVCLPPSAARAFKSLHRSFQGEDGHPGTRWGHSGAIPEPPAGECVCTSAGGLLLAGPYEAPEHSSAVSSTPEMRTGFYSRKFALQRGLRSESQ